MNQVLVLVPAQTRKLIFKTIFMHFYISWQYWFATMLQSLVLPLLFYYRHFLFFLGYFFYWSCSSCKTPPLTNVILFCSKPISALSEIFLVFQKYFNKTNVVYEGNCLLRSRAWPTEAVYRVSANLQNLKIDCFFSFVSKWIPSCWHVSCCWCMVIEDGGGLF